MRVLATRDRADELSCKLNAAVKVGYNSPIRKLNKRSKYRCLGARRHVYSWNQQSVDLQVLFAVYHVTAVKCV